MRVDLAISTEEHVGYPKIVLRVSPSLGYCGKHFRFDLDEPLPLVVLDEPSTYRDMMINHLDQQKYSAGALPILPPPYLVPERPFVLV